MQKIHLVNQTQPAEAEHLLKEIKEITALEQKDVK